MDLLFAAASATFDGTPQPLTTGLSLMARYSQKSLKSNVVAESAKDSTVPSQEVEVQLVRSDIDAQGAADKLAREAAAKEAADKLAREAAEKEAADKLAREAAAKEAADKLAREAAEREAADKLAREAAAKEAADKVAQLPITAQVSADTVVGIRHPRNDQRRVLPDAQQNTHATRGRCSDVYRQLCSLYEVNTNSRVVKILEQHEDNTQIPMNPFEDLMSLDLSLCMLRDKGLLPIVEMLRLCTNLKSLSLASNDISNNGIEYLAHAVVEGTVGSSFEVIDDEDGNDTTVNQAPSSSSTINDRIEKTGATMTSTTNRFGVHIAALDVSDNMISLGGMRLIQLIAEKLPSLVDVKVRGAHVDASEFSELESILEENRLCCG